MNVFDENTITMGTDEASDAMTNSVNTTETICEDNGYFDTDTVASENEMPIATKVKRNLTVDKINKKFGSGSRHYETGADRGNRPYVDVPIHTRRKSKRYETIGLIMRIVDLAGFELADRIVLRDKVTGEILK
jgi:hypothetical protein